MNPRKRRTIAGSSAASGARMTRAQVVSPASLESFTAGCPCGWVSPTQHGRRASIHDVDRHLTRWRKQNGTRLASGSAGPEVIQNKRFGCGSSTGLHRGL